uniref:Uncharacterized protein n=1 Tax=viral metagenome TaxID=1070528 RepID=A0A6C0IA59_9ZZZZ
MGLKNNSSLTFTKKLHKILFLKFLKFLKILILIAVSQATHTGHNAEYVIVDGIDVKRLGCLTTTVQELKLGVVDTGEVAGARWLVLLRAESEGVHCNGIGNTGGTETSVAIPDLVTGEVLEVAVGETISSVKSDLALSLHKGG